MPLAKTRALKRIFSPRARRANKGLHKIESKRKGFAPFNYFRGSPEQLSKLNNRVVIKTFKSAGFELSGREVSRITDEIKEKALSFAKVSTSKKDLGWFLKQPIKRWSGLKPLVTPSGVKLSWFFLRDGPNNWVFDVNTSNGTVSFKLSVRKGGKELLLHQQPVTHGINFGHIVDGSNERFVNSFSALRPILAEGFRGMYGANSISYVNRRHAAQPTITGAPEIVKGDYYSIELMAPHSRSTSKREETFVSRARKNQVTKINVFLSESASKEEIQRKKKFYRELESLTGWPIAFIRPQIEFKAGE